MMALAIETLNRLSQLASEHRLAASLGDESASRQIAEKYRQVLLDARTRGESGFLGEECELPDELMPPDYIKDRTDAISRLEDRLAELAIEFRAAESELKVNALVQQYHQVVEALFLIGHWLAPDADSALPDDLMPESFHERRRNRIANYRLKQKK